MKDKVEWDDLTDAEQHQLIVGSCYTMVASGVGFSLPWVGMPGMAVVYCFVGLYGTFRFLATTHSIFQKVRRRRR